MFSGLTSGLTNQVSGLTSYFGKKPEDGAPEGEQEPKPASPVKEQAAPEPEVLLDADGKPLRYLSQGPQTPTPLFLLQF